MAYKEDKLNLREYYRIYRLNNKEKIKISQDKYRKNNKEKAKEYSREYSIKNREKVKLGHKKYRESNKKRLNEKRRIYYNNNKKILNLKQKENRKNNKEKFSKKDKISNDKRKDYLKNYGVINSKKISSRNKDRNKKIKLEVFQHYVNNKIECECCKIDNIDNLCLDHINNDGAKFRKENKNVRGMRFYKYLKKNNYPNNIKLRILCHNCNQSLGAYGYCPHDKSNPKDRFDLSQYKEYIPSQLKNGKNNPEHYRLNTIKLKIKIVNGYGGKCALCHESQIEFIQLDHIDGKIPEFKKYGKKITGAQLYSYLINENFPCGYRLLCSNCNQHDGKFKGNFK